MKQKTIIIIITILALLSLFNIVCVCAIDIMMDRPHTSYSIEVFGAAFKEENKDANTIEIHLIRPPRTVVVPGETTYPKFTAGNVAEFDVYLRASYKIEVRDADGNVVSGIDDNIKITMNENWEQNGDYFFYKEVLSPNEKVPGPIKSIQYSEEFYGYLDYNVYIPVLVEGIEAKDSSVKEIDNWSGKHIKDINPLDYLKENMSWTQKAEIIIQ